MRLEWTESLVAPLGVAVTTLAVVATAGCGSSEDGTPGVASGGSGGAATTSGTSTSAGGTHAGGSGGSIPVEPCPNGMICPTSFPFHHEGDTSTASRRELDGYSCEPGTDEGGPEIVYRVTLPQAGFLSAAVVDAAANVDIDLHILSSLDAGACLDRGNHHVRAHVDAGVYYVVADTYVASGTEQAGPYSIDIGYVVPHAGDCTMSSDLVERLNGPALQLPTSGPVVSEAHLVTTEDGFGSSWPSAIDDAIDHHYAVSFEATDFVMARSTDWAPQENSQYGQGSTGQKLPVLDEGWYINMMWSDRPAGGTRMIVQLPAGGPAVVASAGYETGPGDPSRIAGVAEEVHFYLGTGHLSELRIGFAVDQSLPLGPLRCP
ncbi:MAG: hypothetical protein JRI23_05145 [Deltaproteobacteria bacterium]|nr:hypothetical protein [Deltaproteobacteria bacterium]MBW2530937.1 hypothetical protein [Deltaproteobacteria bacterium]